MKTFTFKCYSNNNRWVTSVTVQAPNYWTAKNKAEMEEPNYKEYILTNNPDGSYNY